MAFGAIFKKDVKKPAENAAFSPTPAPPARNMGEAPSDMADFENALNSPEKLLSDDFSESPESNSQTQQSQQKPAPKPVQQQPQKIPAFVSLDKYKEIRMSLRDIKIASLEMRKTIENLRQNRDGGTALLNNTIGGLERIEGNIDKIRTVLRT